ETAAEKDPWAAFWLADKYIDQPYAQRVIEAAAEKNPWKALEFADKYIDQPYAQRVIETAAERDPRAALEYTEILKDSKKPAIRVILTIKDSDYSKREKERISILLHEIVLNKMTLKEAYNIVRDNKRFFEALVRIKAQPNHLGEVSVDGELKDICLRKVQSINDLHNEPDEVRFASVNDAGPQELYTLMVYGQEEIFTSSFNGLFNRMLSRMQQEGLRGDQLLEDLGYNRFRVFLKETADFNQMNRFLDTMSQDSAGLLLERFVQDIDKERNPLFQAVVVADAFSMIEDSSILEILQSTIKIEYERVKTEENKEAEVIYGLLAGMFGKKAVINESWIKEMSEKYELPDIVGLSSAGLFNQDRTNIQQYFFYNDGDGLASYNNFLDQYDDNSGWSIEDKGSYIIISSEMNPQGQRIEIYANKPEQDYKGQEEIAKLFSQNDISASIIVHRGHSYHVDKTVEKIPSTAKIVSLGSCGGYNNVDAILRKSPNSHFIGTKGKGTMWVNDPLLKMLNGQILTGKDIHWPSFWTKAEARLGGNGDFRNYISPHRNLGVLFLKAYNQQISKQPKQTGMLQAPDGQIQVGQVVEPQTIQQAPDAVIRDQKLFNELEKGEVLPKFKKETTQEEVLGQIERSLDGTLKVLKDKLTPEAYAKLEKIFNEIKANVKFAPITDDRHPDKLAYTDIATNMIYIRPKNQGIGFALTVLNEYLGHAEFKEEREALNEVLSPEATRFVEETVSLVKAKKFVVDILGVSNFMEFATDAFSGKSESVYAKEWKHIASLIASGELAKAVFITYGFSASLGGFTEVKDALVSIISGWKKELSSKESTKTPQEKQEILEVISLLEQALPREYETLGKSYDGMGRLEKITYILKGESGAIIDTVINKYEYDDETGDIWVSGRILLGNTSATDEELRVKIGADGIPDLSTAQFATGEHAGEQATSITYTDRINGFTEVRDLKTETRAVYKEGRILYETVGGITTKFWSYDKEGNPTDKVERVGSTDRAIRYEFIKEKEDFTTEGTAIRIR
ncbi:MAG: hypothetical protein KKB24_03855, partial [Candidatus Altiarchaeota archaeon]|nr:hypothetical protein [Candidatus Altiarchaeota archaeon]